MNKTTLGDRMKAYEKAFCHSLPPRMPVIIRLDGKAFHTLTRECVKPFDKRIEHAMESTALALMQQIQNAVFAYTQSDEISILLHNYKKYETQPWFDNKIQKMVSISAAMASVQFSNIYSRDAFFDSRVFVLPESEVCNYFIWRQRDWKRNSVQMLARSLYSHKELHKKKNKQLKEMCLKKGKDWEELSPRHKYGLTIHKEDLSWAIDREPPEFCCDRNFVEKHLKVVEQ